jgi:DNA-binding MarR family transcriptional regulator
MPHGSLPFRVLNEIGIIAQLSQTAFERVMPSGMTLSQFTVLNHFVRLGGSRSPAQLASAFQVTRATMTSTLQRLEAKGLVALHPDPADGRGKLVDITQAGKAMQSACIEALGPEFDRLGLGTLTAEMDSLLPLLQHLRQVFDMNRLAKPIAHAENDT